MKRATIDNSKATFLSGGASKAAISSPEGAISSQLPGRHDGPADAYRHLLLSAETYRRFG